MKLAKLSLAAMVVAGLATSSFAADTLADAFAKGKVSGELRAWYFDKDAGSTDAQIINTGLVLGYVTDTYYGLMMGATMQSNFAPFADDDAKKMFDGDQYGSGAVLSEVYLGYKMKGTTVKVGRQFISTPLVNGSGSRMIKEAFEGATIVNTDLPGTTLVAGYVGKFQGRTSQVTPGVGVVDGVSDIPEFSKKAIFYGASSSALAFDGAYTAAIINKSVPNLTITGQYALVNEVTVGTAVSDVSVYVGALNYVLPMGSFKLGFDGAYQASDEDFTALALSGDMIGLQASLIDLAGFSAKLAYTTTSNDDGLILGMGNGAGGAVAYTAPLVSGAAKVATKDTDAYKLEVSYDFGKVGVTGLTAMAQYVDISEGSATDYTYLAGQIAYALPSVKGLTLSIDYEDATKEVTGAADLDTSDFRFRANYKF